MEFKLTKNNYLQIAIHLFFSVRNICGELLKLIKSSPSLILYNLVGVEGWRDFRLGSDCKVDVEALPK